MTTLLGSDKRKPTFRAQAAETTGAGGSPIVLQSCPMESKSAAMHLAEAQRHVIDCQLLVGHQRALIATLTREGRDVDSASALLRKLERSLALQVEDLYRIRTEVDVLPSLRNS